MSSYKRCNIAKTGQQIFELFVGNNKFFRISLLKSIKCKVVSTLFYQFFSTFSYGLLGASGCGKTTVLSMIVGLNKLDSGHLSVFGGYPGDGEIEIPGKKVGYMPQVNIKLISRKF